MSTQPAFQPVCTRTHGPVAVRIVPRSRDLGGFSVRRVLPSSERQMVGPFIFFDEMGPAVFPPGEGIDVRPHPHIGIATITYLFDGEIMHRDSLGYALPIRPGAVNLMTAGRGIVHSERAGSDRDVESSMHGIQSWIALPDGLEEIEPAFTHTPAADLPEVSVDGATVRLILGEAFGAASPVRSYSKTLYAEVRLPAGGRFALPGDLTDRAVYVVSGNVAVGDEEYGTGVMAVFRTGAPVELEAAADTRLMLIGGGPVGERAIWWNFVSSSEARIEQAKEDWREGRFDRVEGDDGFIPLPEQP
jgi:redox-sensitive bicupin YhaK (pirin superfamily)